MSRTRCPAGHDSDDPEWCDICGARIGGSAEQVTPRPPHSPPPAAPGGNGGQTAPPVACPNCAVLNGADNLFCEGCGHDFTTGQNPPPSSTPSEGAADDDAVATASGEAGSARPPEQAPAPVLAAADGEQALGAPSAWVAVVEVSAEWYALKGALADRPCPPPSTSTVAIVGHTALIGRSSQSKSIRPEIALDTDTGVSRRHAQFVIDGSAISIVDQSSTNGTFVVGGGQQPDADTEPIEPGVNVALDDGDSVYLGAWTRLTVRRR